MSAFGIDFGNENCVVAVARKGGIDIAINEASNRQTPYVRSVCLRMHGAGVTH